MTLDKTRKFYRAVAEHYHAVRTNTKTRGWLYNEYIEMPAMLKVTGNIKRKKVLDLGCGSGLLTRKLKQKGANVCGIDISPDMLAIAKRELPTTEFKVGDGTHLPYQNSSFDVVTASLVMEYIKDWDQLLKEIHCILKRGGYFVFSMGNPVMNAKKKIYIGKKRRKEYIIKEYFNERKMHSSWPVLGHGKASIWYHKTYTTIVRTLRKNRFAIEDYEDTKILSSAKKFWPEAYNRLKHIPYFCVWKVRKE